MDEVPNEGKALNHHQLSETLTESLYLTCGSEGFSPVSAQSFLCSVAQLFPALLPRSRLFPGVYSSILSPSRSRVMQALRFPA